MCSTPTTSAARDGCICLDRFLTPVIPRGQFTELFRIVPLGAKMVPRTAQRAAVGHDFAAEAAPPAGASGSERACPQPPNRWPGWPLRAGLGRVKTLATIAGAAHRRCLIRRRMRGSMSFSWPEVALGQTPPSARPGPFAVDCAGLESSLRPSRGPIDFVCVRETTLSSRGLRHDLLRVSSL
jgi:hypothetical protein